MKLRLRSLLLVVATVLPFAATPVPSHAADAFTFSGNGTISPGLGVTPVPQSFSMTGTATAVGTDGVLTTSSCSFSGYDNAGSLAEGFGTMSGACGSWYWCRVGVYVRVGHHKVIICVEAVSVGQMQCVFVPTDVNPTTKFSFTCAGTVV